MRIESVRIFYLYEIYVLFHYCLDSLVTSNNHINTGIVSIN